MANETQQNETQQNAAAFCRAGKHHVEPGKNVTRQGWCNLCLRDAQRNKKPGTTARERGLK